MLNIQTGTISRCHKYLDNMGKINQRSVQRLPQEIKDFLREITPKRLKELAKMNCYAAEKIKTKLDNQYGENNYILLSIGRSLSSITELLRIKGVKVKQLPISGLREQEFKTSTISHKNLIIYKLFLQTIGLTKNSLKENSNKMYILTDYTYKGRSLNKVFDFLNDKKILDSPENLIKIPINDILEEDYSKKYIKNLFIYSRFKYFSIVGELYPTNLNKVFIQSSEDKIPEYNRNFTKGTRKLFWFNVFDSMLNETYKNILPIKELEAIDKNFLSPQAIQNFINKEQQKIQKIKPLN